MFLALLDRNSGRGWARAKNSRDVTRTCATTAGAAGRAWWCLRATKVRSSSRPTHSRNWWTCGKTTRDMPRLCEGRNVAACIRVHPSPSVEVSGSSDTPGAPSIRVPRGWCLSSLSTRSPQAPWRKDCLQDRLGWKCPPGARGFLERWEVSTAVGQWDTGGNRQSPSGQSWAS